MNQTVNTFTLYPDFFYGTVIIFSLLVGSFLNVVIYRLPKILEQGWKQECRAFLADELDNSIVKANSAKETSISLSKPDSSCPHCGHNIRFYENVPIVSWLFLRGKCSQCQNKISIRYPLVEASTALIGFLVAHHFGVTATTFWVLLLSYALICLTLIDFDHMLLPDQITLPFLWLGLLLNLNGLIVPINDAVIGAAVGYLSLFSVFWLFKAITGKEGMGFGDFKLLALFGAWLGWQLLAILILMASVVGAVIGIGLMVFNNHQREQAIPFGPYLAIAGWITLMWGNSIWTWYLNLIT
ncbi:MAG: prepilin peptidase [Gammaproteobacteria bacterium]|nr:MAG: prepilin peptidase [Gammaproteobacteria bacterium]